MSSDENWPELAIDSTVGALYVTLSSERITRTVDLGSVVVDYDAFGRAVGVEVLHCPRPSDNPVRTAASKHGGYAAVVPEGFVRLPPPAGPGPVARG